MIIPDRTQFKQLARKGNVVAVSRTIPADLETPVSCFLKLAQNEPHAFLLESAEQEEKIGRYSFIGLDPRIILSSKADKVEIENTVQKSKVSRSEPIHKVLEESLETFQLANPENLPNYCGGFVGFIGYENVQFFEQIKLAKRPGLDVPDSLLVLPQTLVMFDHFRKTLVLVRFVFLGKSKAPSLQGYKAATQQIEAIIRQLKRPLALPLSAKKSSAQALKLSEYANMKPSSFYQKVNKIKSYIRAGDAIQVVLSQRFTLPPVRSDFQIYRALRSVNPSPYMYYFRSGKLRIIGSSPEMLVKKTGTEAELRPIAGTRPRGKNPAEDLKFEEHLKKSTKEMAEHLMLVDLGRNDLGRVCEFDSVRVKNFARVERYSHVMHLVSDIVGKLKRGKTAFDLLKATFPAGTLSGAPKIRAMQIINELEEEKRGPYGGALGYFSFNRDMNLCIVIRTLVVDGKKIYLQAGAGIVKDSNPKKEYQETLNKAGALFGAIKRQGEF